MKKNKVIYAVLFFIILVGIIVYNKFNFSLEYSDSKRIDIYIGKEISIDDLRELSQNVFQNKQVILQEVENFGDMVALTVKDVSDEELDTLVTKINEMYKEKYGEEYVKEHQLELSKDTLSVSSVPHYRIRDMVKRYAIPSGIAGIAIIIYILIRYRKISPIKRVIETIYVLLTTELIYFSIISITRLQINKYTIPLAAMIAVITLITVMYKCEGTLGEILGEKEEEKE